MKVSQRLAEQTALTAALAERARIAMNDLEEVGMADASALFEDIISDDQALRAEYNKQYGKLRNMVNKRG